MAKKKPIFFNSRFMPVSEPEPYRDDYEVQQYSISKDGLLAKIELRNQIKKDFANYMRHRWFARWYESWTDANNHIYHSAVFDPVHQLVWPFNVYELSGGSQIHGVIYTGQYDNGPSYSDEFGKLLNREYSGALIPVGTFTGDPHELLAWLGLYDWKLLEYPKVSSLSVIEVAPTYSFIRNHFENNIVNAPRESEYNDIDNFDMPDMYSVAPIDEKVEPFVPGVTPLEDVSTQQFNVVPGYKAVVFNNLFFNIPQNTNVHFQATNRLWLNNQQAFASVVVLTNAQGNSGLSLIPYAGSYIEVAAQQNTRFLTDATVTLWKLQGHTQYVDLEGYDSNENQKVKPWTGGKEILRTWIYKQWHNNGMHIAGPIWPCVWPDERPDFLRDYQHALIDWPRYRYLYELEKANAFGHYFNQIPIMK